FSAVVGQNGGGAYLVPYLLAALVFALPLLILEISVGRALRVDVVSAFRSVRERFAPLGWIVSGSVVLILSYYLVLTGWVLDFFVRALVGVPLSFDSFAGSFEPVGAFVVSTLIAGAVVSLGVKAGIERMSKVVVPAIFAVLLGLVAYAVTLPGFAAGVAFLFTPDFSVLGDPLVWSAAFGQVFFSLSVGQGIMLTYGSYLDESADVPRAALAVTLADVAVALLAGLVIFPVVFTFGLEPTLGTQLAFSTLPRAFEEMAFGRVVAIGFFGMLFFAALSSAVSLLEVGVASAGRVTDRSRGTMTLLVTAVVFLLGLPSALSYSRLHLSLAGLPVLDLMDETVGTLALPVTAVLIAVVFTWYQSDETLRRQVGDSVVVPLVKYAIPLVLVGVTGFRLALNVDFPGWHVLPGAHFVGRLPQVAGALAALVVLLIAGRLLSDRLAGSLGRRTKR
ncbi:MAG: sodium-dependent transporter, partial [Salinigranum sp.]